MANYPCSVCNKICSEAVFYQECADCWALFGPCHARKILNPDDVARGYQEQVDCPFCSLEIVEETLLLAFLLNKIGKTKEELLDEYRAAHRTTGR